MKDRSIRYALLLVLSVFAAVTVARAQGGTGVGGIFAPEACDLTENAPMGNASGAVEDINFPLNFLFCKPQYVMSYNRDRGEPNWVAWHLDTPWLGGAPRQDDYRGDTSLPSGWYRVVGTDYSGSGFNRGHHCPSQDRTSSVADNSATFLMTNMMPQAPDNNQGPWAGLENYSKMLEQAGYELYTYAGGTGQGGTGSNGGVTATVASGNVTVPAFTWKVVMVITKGSNDLLRVTTSTRTIAVIMPNTQGIRTTPWQAYLVSVDQVEALTGYDFFSNVPPATQAPIEATVDLGGPIIGPTSASLSVSGRVLNAAGMGIRNARVTLQDQTGAVRTAITNGFGYFRMDRIATGSTFVASASARGYRFAPRLIQVFDPLSDVDFGPQ